MIAVTIKDVARHTGLSTATISKYINGVRLKEENAKMIKEAIRTLGYKPNEIARGLKTNKTNTVGVLVPSLENIFAMSIISNIEEVLLRKGYSMILCDYRQDSRLENNKFDFLMNKLVDGFIIMPLGIDADRIVKALENNVPVVLIDRMMQGLECDVVIVDNLNASYNAVEQLIVNGHKRIGIICGSRDIYTSQERLKGYLRVHEDYHLHVEQRLIKYGDCDIESGYKLVNEFLDDVEPPTAVFVTNYEMTLGTVMALNERNVKIPEELSLVGFDNIQLAKIVKPTLSIVIQPMKQIGETAANLLLRRLKGDRSGFPDMFRLKTELLTGQSIDNIRD